MTKKRDWKKKLDSIKIEGRSNSTSSDNNDQLFFSLWRNKFIKNKIILSSIDSIIIKDLSVLGRYRNKLLYLKENGVSIVYKIKDLSSFDIYTLFSCLFFGGLEPQFILPSECLPYLIKTHQKQKLVEMIYGISISTDDQQGVDWLKQDFLQSIKYLEYQGLTPIPENYIPQSVTAIDFREFSEIQVNVLPKNCKSLNLGFRRSDEIESIEEIIPQGLTNLSISGLWSCSLNIDLLPKSLVKLDLTHFYGRMCGDRVNNNVKHLTTPWDTPNISNLFYSVTHFDLSCTALENVFLPPALKYLKVNHFKPISALVTKFPPTLTSLISDSFSGIKDLTLQDIPNVVQYQATYSEGAFIPPHVTDLTLKLPIDIKSLPIIPSRVEKLDIDFKSTHVPIDYFSNNSTLAKLSIRINHVLQPGSIPNTVTILKIKTPHPIQANVIPASVTKLRLTGDKINNHQHSVLPKTVKTLCLYDISPLLFNNDIQVLRHVETVKFSRNSCDMDPKNLFQQLKKFKPLPSNLKYFKFDNGIHHIVGELIVFESIPDSSTTIGIPLFK
ncbi:hypothetical protein CYY_008395 [Polysphondylium violaceum]|uniref:FNIP repeat-containing protein n=1 Tax=Polysphondylium violaceum TaxID=133409 RepID=A0A8J4V3Z2_9MYCE|nr:hypothetical protein CYY_008395 [Polysphondylium violaceum]